MGLFQRIFGKGGRPVLKEVAALLGEPPSPGLASAVGEIEKVLTHERVGPGLAILRPRLILIFARQSADATMRLSSGHWTSDRGHNVGMDVLRAQGLALVAFLAVLDRRPRSKRPLLEAAVAIEALTTDWRAAPGDPDGYGIATLHEIRRDIADLI